MKILFIGDIVGSPGRNMLAEYLPRLKKSYKPDVTVVNGENAAHGKGLTEKIYKQLLEIGADVITMGNHTWDKREIFEYINDANSLVVPANFPPATPGKGYKVLNVNGQKVAVINLIGRTFMADQDCPFRKADEILKQLPEDTAQIFVDFHAETTSEKQALGWYLDGRVTAVCGTHTHVQTADERILPQGTGYISDVGMTGPYDGILGMSRDAVMKKFLTNLPVKFEVEEGREQINGVFIQAAPRQKAVQKMKRIAVNDEQPLMD
ncbi:hypothetical protein B0H94_101173 [Salsuginibacillus halophilus]|uniref:Metallophosphoesterase n=1 Tax=Salsuginibacillus halophilus TaxID=517424 RepID=A0A2P8HYH4_9BACI|nr:TIGR00282 family metallophosphoesterase [Salsuginibacillus halophilus]PSL51263.1 hypothetical protein B0H94_101173 [Salsuginibacillus halophilus]